MYQINPPIIQIDFSVDSLRTFDAHQYLKIRSKKEREEFKFEIIDNIEGTLWVRIYLEEILKTVPARMNRNDFMRVLEIENDELESSGFDLLGRIRFYFNRNYKLKLGVIQISD